MTPKRFRIPLAFWFILPSACAILLFFFLPVVLTFVFSFTNMSSDTGILGNRYLFSQDRLQALGKRQLDAELLSRLKHKVYVFSNENISKLRSTKLKPAIVNEIEKKYAGKVYTSEKALNDDLKKMINRPRSFRERKAIAKAMLQTMVGREFGHVDQVRAAFKVLGIQVSEEDLKLILRETNTSWKWTTENYNELFAGQFTGKIFLNTLKYVFVTLIFLNIGFSLVLAIVTFYMPDKQSKFFRAVWLIPRISPPVVYILLWKWLGSNVGLISYICKFLGITPTNWVNEFPWVFVFLVNGFVGASMGMIIFSSAMQAISKNMLWSSALDGAYLWQQVTRIILPQLKWPILFITSYQTLSLLTSFEYIQLLTDGGPGFYTTEVWSLYAFHSALFNYFGNLRYGFGAALAVVLVAIGITASLLYLRFFKFGELVREPLIEQ